MQQLVDNRYRLRETLGSGGMADVYLAHDDVLDRPLALKILSGRYANDEEFVERFRREARNAASLSHPNIVSIYDRGETGDGTYYIAMEYLPGGTLKDRLNKRGPLPARTAAAVALQIAEALRCAHDSGVVHRDIKPHNILITESGDIKVTDFGIARAASSSTMTRTGSILGTAHYLSPEQAMGEPVRPASDLYSLGVVLYEMLTGELPYDAETPIGIAMKHVNGHLRPPIEVDPSIPAGINAVVMRLLARDPEDRYASASTLIADLERVSAGLEPEDAGTREMTRVMPSPQAPPPRATRKDPGPRRRSRLLVPILLALLLLAGLGWAAYSLLQGGQEDPQPVMLAVPDLSGITLEEARQQHGEDFEIVEDSREDSVQPENTVLSQDPGADEQLERGSEIGVTVASGQNVVPSVEGLTAGDAQQALSDAGFGASVAEAESSADQEGLVIDQSPDSGESAGLGTEVGITVGTGPAPVEVPNLYGYTLDEASAELEGLGLALGGSDTAPSDDVEEGGIIYQSIEAGASVDPGTEVAVTVSSGPEWILVPDVTGQSLSSAQQSVSTAGFDVETLEVQNSGWPAETVLYTDPPAGSAAEPGSTVTIAYSSGPSQTPPEPEDDGGNGDGGNDDGEDNEEEAREARQDRQEALREARQAREEAREARRNRGGNRDDD